METLSVSLASSLQQEFFVPDITNAVAAASIEKADGTTIAVYQVVDPNSKYSFLPFVTVRKPAGTGSSGAWSPPLPISVSTAYNSIWRQGVAMGLGVEGKAWVFLKYRDSSYTRESYWYSVEDGDCNFPAFVAVPNSFGVFEDDPVHGPVQDANGRLHYFIPYCFQGNNPPNPDRRGVWEWYEANDGSGTLSQGVRIYMPSFIATDQRTMQICVQSSRPTSLGGTTTWEIMVSSRGGIDGADQSGGDGGGGAQPVQPAQPVPSAQSARQRLAASVGRVAGHSAAALRAEPQPQPTPSPDPSADGYSVCVVWWAQARDPVAYPTQYTGGVEQRFGSSGNSCRSSALNGYQIFPRRDGQTPVSPYAGYGDQPYWTLMVGPTQSNVYHSSFSTPVVLSCTNMPAFPYSSYIDRCFTDVIPDEDGNDTIACCWSVMTSQGSIPNPPPSYSAVMTTGYQSLVTTTTLATPTMHTFGSIASSPLIVVCLNDTFTNWKVTYGSSNTYHLVTAEYRDNGTGGQDWIETDHGGDYPIEYALSSHETREAYSVVMLIMDINNGMGLYMLSTQDQTWHTEDLDFPEADWPADGSVLPTQSYYTYRTVITVTDALGVPRANVPFSWYADFDGHITINGAHYHLRIDHPSIVTNGAGQFVVDLETNLLCVGKMQINCRSFNIQPSTVITIDVSKDTYGNMMTQLKGCGSDGSKLAALTDSRGQPVIANSDIRGNTDLMDKVADTFNDIAQLTPALMSLQHTAVASSSSSAVHGPLSAQPRPQLRAGHCFTWKAPARGKDGSPSIGATPTVTARSVSVLEVAALLAEMQSGALCLTVEEAAADLRSHCGRPTTARGYRRMSVATSIGLPDWIEDAADGLKGVLFDTLVFFVGPDGADNVVTFAYTVASGAKRYFRAVLNKLKDFALACQGVWNLITVFFDDLVRWIGYLFYWQDFVDSRNALVGQMNLMNSSSIISTATSWLGSNLNTVFEGFKGNHKAMEDSLSSYGGANSVVSLNNQSSTSTPYTDPSQAGEVMNSPQNIGGNYLMEAVADEATTSFQCRCPSDLGIRPVRLSDGSIQPPSVVLPMAHPHLACILHRQAEPLPVCRVCRKPRSRFRRRRRVPREWRQQAALNDAKRTVAMDAERQRYGDDADPVTALFTTWQSQSSSSNAPLTDIAGSVTSSKSTDDFLSNGFGALITKLNTNTDSLFDALEAAMGSSMASVLGPGATAAAGSFTTFVPYIPVLSELLVQFFKVPKSSMQLFDILSFVVAIPATIMCKLVFKRAPMDNLSVTQYVGWWSSNLLPLHGIGSSDELARAGRLGADIDYDSVAKASASFAVIYSILSVPFAALDLWLSSSENPLDQTVLTYVKVIEAGCEWISDVFGVPWVAKLTDKSRQIGSDVQVWPQTNNLLWLMSFVQTVLDITCTAVLIRQPKASPTVLKNVELTQALLNGAFGAVEIGLAAWIVNSQKVEVYTIGPDKGKSPWDSKTQEAASLAAANILTGIGNLMKPAMYLLGKYKVPYLPYLCFAVTQIGTVIPPLIEAWLVDHPPPDPPPGSDSLTLLLPSSPSSSSTGGRLRAGVDWAGGRAAGGGERDLDCAHPIASVVQLPGGVMRLVYRPVARSECLPRVADAVRQANVMESAMRAAERK